MTQTLFLISLALSSVQALKLLSQDGRPGRTNLEQKSSSYVLNTATEISPDELMHEREQWMQKPGQSCPALKNKWIYIRGDSTTRQVVKLFLTDYGIHMNDTEIKSFVRQQCARPPHADDFHSFKSLHKEYGRVDCSLNEKRCQWSAGQSKITYDWQHFVLEEREKFLFNKDAMQDASHDFKDRLPDLLVMGLPVHPCYHTTKNSNIQIKKNQEAEDLYRSQLKDLHSAVRSVYKGPVVWLEAGAVTTAKDPEARDFMRCLTSMNEELNHVIKTDEASHIIHRQSIEAKFVRTHPWEQGIHKSNDCVQEIYKSICSQMQV